MNKIDWKTYKFRASSMDAIMTSSRSKTDPLSETAKARLVEIWVAEVYGRENYGAKNKYTDKGIQCESDGFDLIKQNTGQTYFKNQTTFKNDFIMGTPDIHVEKLRIKDTKLSWDLWSYVKATEDYAKKTYFYQGQSYMWLTNTKFVDFDFCLVNTPEETIEKELYKLSFSMPERQGNGPEAEAMLEKVRRNYIFDDIPADERMKEYTFEFDPEAIEAMKEKVKYAREYLATLKLKP